MQIAWTDQAKEHLVNIEHYIKQESEEIARRTVLRIVEKTKIQLLPFPQSAKPGKITDTRELYFSDIPYFVIYTSDNKTITILSIFHTAQNR
ncbi:MAG: type II toxin-antitoxin system RelE/ParE family toxin [Chlorobium sp.]|nr:type II toxin-antitoxin system RelE/ParE family toxin [Chlorobium sp.]